jgi:hypothetical protein
MLGGVFGPEPRKYATWLLVSTRRSRNIPRISVEPLGSARLFPPIEASRYPRWPESVLREYAAGANSGYWSAPLATFGPLSREAGAMVAPMRTSIPVDAFGGYLWKKVATYGGKDEREGP